MLAIQRAVLALATMVFALGQMAIPSDEKVRVYIADSQSWEITGGWGYSKGSAGGQERGGARPQTVEIIKTFNERCPALTVTNNKDRASFAIILDHEGGKALLAHKNKIAVFNRQGDVIFSRSTLSLGGAVKDACSAIETAPESERGQAVPATTAGVVPTPVMSAPASPSTPTAAAPTVQTALVQSDSPKVNPVNTAPIAKIALQGDSAPVAPPVSQHAELARIIPASPPLLPLVTPNAQATIAVTFASNPPGAVVSCNGMPFGRTPFVIPMLPGTYPIKFELRGYPDWDSQITVDPAKPMTLVAQLNSTTGVVLK